MAGHKMVDCRDCGEACFWVKSPKQKPMLMDFQPVSNGKWVLESTESERDPWVAKKSPDGYTGDRYECHWDTCRDKKPRPSAPPVSRGRYPR